MKSDQYRWLPRAYFDGAESANGFVPQRPLRLELYYNSTNTETINAQSLQALGRLNIVYWVKSYAAGNKVNITLSRFDESDRWYVTSGTSSSALFYDQSSALSNAGKERVREAIGDPSTPEQHRARYGGGQPASGERTAPTGRFCPQCGQGLPAEANFCPKCGAKLR